MYFSLVIINRNKLTKEEAIKVGEQKYLEFLWMVDGAFNSDELGDFIINGKKLDDSKKIFTCKYNKNKDSCIGSNFENEFKKVFAKSILFEDVYSDSKIYTWYEYDNGKYKFSNNHNCSTDRMPINQEIKISRIENNKLVFIIDFINDDKKQSRSIFELIKENNEWKVSKAYYHDLCNFDYYID